MQESEYGGIIGQNQAWKDRHLDCDYCEYDEGGYFRERYPDGGFPPLDVCPVCGCGQ